MFTKHLSELKNEFIRQKLETKGRHSGAVIIIIFLPEMNRRVWQLQINLLHTIAIFITD